MALLIIFGIIIGIALCALTVISTWKVFVKAGKPGWASLVPFYREVVIWQISDLPLSYLLIGLLLPFADVIYMVSIHMYFAQKHNKSRLFGLGLYVLPFIFMPVLAFSKPSNKKVKNDDVVLLGVLLTILTCVLFVVLPLILKAALAIFLIVITIVATWRAFEKVGKPGWASLIPVYRDVVIWQISELPVAYLLIGLLVPFVNIIFMAMIYASFAKKYDRSGLFGFGLCILPFIFMPILAFSKDKKEDYEKPSSLACGLLLLVLTLFIVVATVPWDTYFTKFTLFNDFNTWLSKIDVFKNLIAAPAVVDASTASTTGVIPALGNWQLTDISIFLIIISIFVMLFSDAKLDDFLPEMSEKTKKALPIGLITVITSFVLIILVTSGVNVTITNYVIGLANGKFNIVTTSIGAMLGSLTTSDFYYYLSTLYIPFKAAGTETYYGVIALLVQGVYYITMIAAPTSVALLAGLYALDIPYGSWLKYIWKVLLTTFLVVVITSAVLYLIVAKHVTLAIVIAGIAALLLFGSMIFMVKKN